MLKRILEIERRIANSIIYNIPLWFLENKSHEYSSEFLIKIENGNILSLDCKEWDILFPNIKNQVNESNKLKKDDLTKYLKKDNSSKDIPIWKLSQSWTFKTLILIFRGLFPNLRKKIIYDLFPNTKINNNEFITIMELLNDIRNKVCHNKTIYNFSRSYYREKLKKFINNNDNSFLLKDVVKIIAIFNLDEETSLNDKIENEIIRCKKRMEEIVIDESKLKVNAKKVKIKNENIIRIISDNLLNKKNR